MTPAGTFLLLVFWGSAILAGWAIGRHKGRPGWAFALALGWLGVLIVACLPRTHEAKVAAERERQAVSAEAQLPPPPPLLQRDARGRTVTPGFEQAHNMSRED